MKKYVKPELFFESFELSQQIAACDYDSEHTNTTVEACTFTWDFNPEAKLFVKGNGDCEVTDYEDYCCHSSTDGISLFNS